MRAYLPITPKALQSFLEVGKFRGTSAFVADPDLSEESNVNSEDAEEREFEVSWEAAMQSREMQAGPPALGFVLAVDLRDGQTESSPGDGRKLIEDISWSQVQCLLVAESQEQELSWFAPQEIDSYLPQWLA